jgi:flagellar capping protein FliD
MDDGKDKNVIEKFVDKINDVVENITNTTSEALQHASEPDPAKSGEKAVVYIMPMAYADGR